MREVLTLERLAAMPPEAAAALLVCRRSEGAGQADAAALAAWLALDLSHARAWADAQAAWSDFDAADDDEILTALREHARRAGPERPSWALPMAAAAALVLILGAALGLGLHRAGGPALPGGGGPATHAPHPVELYANAGDAPETHRLADGSRLVLDKASRARVSMAPERREVRLERGRAFFDVARDANRPFVVQAGGQEIRALGTQFDVRLDPGEMRIILLEGRVSVRSPGQAQGVALGAGQQWLLQAGQAPRIAPLDPADPSADWHVQYVVFDNVTLAEAAAELSRAGSARLIVRDPELAALRVSGRFRVGDLPRFGRALAMLHPVRLVARGDGAWEIVRAR